MKGLSARKRLLRIFFSSLFQWFHQLFAAMSFSWWTFYKHSNHAHNVCMYVSECVRIDLIYGFEWHVVVGLTAVCFWHLVFYFLLLLLFLVGSIDSTLRMKLHLCLVCVHVDKMRMLCILCTWHNKMLWIERKRDNIEHTTGFILSIGVNNFGSLSETWQTYKFLFFSLSTLCMS